MERKANDQILVAGDEVKIIGRQEIFIVLESLNKSDRYLIVCERDNPASLPVIKDKLCLYKENK